MDVQVGDALGDGVVDADEAAVRAGGSCHGRADLPYPREQRPGQFWRQVSQRQIVQAGDDQHVAFEHRAGVEECHGVLVGGHDGLIGFFSRGDRAENAAAHAVKVTSPGSAALRLCAPLRAHRRISGAEPDHPHVRRG